MLLHQAQLISLDSIGHSAVAPVPHPANLEFFDEQALRDLHASFQLSSMTVLLYNYELREDAVEGRTLSDANGHNGFFIASLV